MIHIEMMMRRKKRIRKMRRRIEEEECGIQSHIIIKGQDHARYKCKEEEVIIQEQG
jgi:hypothetical protein